MTELGVTTTRELQKEAIILTLMVGAGFAARLILGPQGEFAAGHIDAACATNPVCLNVVLKNLPLIVPAIGEAIRVGRTLTTSDCSEHPDGGTNLSIRLED